MATWDEYNSLISQAIAGNAQADSISLEATGYNTQADSLMAAGSAAITAANAATADAQRIDGKIAALETSFATQLGATENKIGATAQTANALTHRMNTMRNPTTGELSPAETVVLSLHELHRDSALTAEEYDALGLTAAEFDAHDGITCITYDLMGKTILA